MYTKKARDEITQAIIDKGVECPSTAPFCNFDEFIAQIETGGGSSSANVVNYSYVHTSGSSSYSRTYTGNVGSTLLLLLMHREPLSVMPTDWDYLGILYEMGEYNDGTINFGQYVSIFTKTCVGTESFSYTCVESTMSTTCIIEFSNVDSIELLESTRQENIVSTSNLTLSSKTKDLAVWVLSSAYFTSDKYSWDVSGTSILQVSTDMQCIPRLGVLIDAREVRNDFIVSSRLNNARYYNSAMCIKIKSGGGGQGNTGMLRVPFDGE